MLRPEQLEVNDETVAPMDTAGIWKYNSRVSKFSVEFSSASPPQAKTGMKRKMEAEPSNPRKDRRMSDQ